jgi:hypothetical protein
VTTPDEIVLTFPRERPFYGIANLVLGGLATRLSASVESLQDLQIALESLLEFRDGDDEVTVSLRVVDGSLEAAVGPFDEAVEAELATEADGGLGLRRILDTVADSVAVQRRRDGHWIELRKKLASANGGVP